MRIVRLVVCCLALASVPAVAQEHEHQHSPYAGQPSSGIASLSPDELDDLQSGAGMGLARAAELNHYPGPLHALEWADSLGLTPAQLVQVDNLRQQMLDRAIAIGERIVAYERELSNRFERQHIDSTGLAAVTAALGALYGELRYVHLSVHLVMKEILTADQVEEYDRLRGYVE